MSLTEGGLTNSQKRVIETLRQIYNQYRSALLNRKYYGHRLETAQQFNLGFECVIAIGATGSGIAGWALWKGTGIGELTWAFIAGAASLFAILKPILNVPKRVERMSKLWVAHSRQYNDLKRLVDKVRRMQNVDAEIERTFDEICSKTSELDSLDDPKPSKRLIKRYSAEVRREIPAHTLWMPDYYFSENQDKAAS
ncbi:MAG: hypothetical protein MJE12_17585 [Alphaproteobacteria bacterium]|nr:hypothetical protein [Alphaproteobacteria bacterium]